MNNTLDKGLHILEHLADQAREFSIAEVAGDLGFGRSMVHRLLSTLVERGYVSRNPRTRRYAVALRPVELSAEILGRMPLRSRAAPYLRRLADDVGRTTYLGVPHLGKNLILLVSYPHGVFRPDDALMGGTGPLHPTAIGKVLLAFRDDVRGEALAGRKELEPRSDKTITSPEELLRHLEQVRERGYAETLGENGADVGGVAAPVYDREGVVVAGLGAAMPLAEYLDDSLGAPVREAVREAATSVSFAMGFEKAYLLAR